MATVKVQDNGKAPSGLVAGDSVVTAGGTYKITGVNADGSYKSELVDKTQTTKTYSGGYSSVESPPNNPSVNSNSGIGSSGNGVSSYVVDYSRNQSLAGQAVKQGQYTVTYDNNGYAIKAIKDGGASATNKLTHINDSEAHYKAYLAAMQGDWDAVGNYINEIGRQSSPEWYIDNNTGAYVKADNITGEAPSSYTGIYDMAAANEYMQELQNEFNYNAKEYYDKLYDQAYGNGSAAAFDASGGAIKTIDEWNKATGGAALPAGSQGNDFGAMIPTNMNGGQAGVAGYGSMQEFMDAMGYGNYAEQTQKAIQAAVQQAINGYNRQIEQVNSDSEELARQAYIAKMLGQKNLDQKLSANGYAGGMADSQRIATELSYQNELGALERQKEETVKELRDAITNAQLTGDIQTAQELSAYIQQLQSQWNSYLQSQQVMANQNYWNQQSVNTQTAETAYNRAMTLLSAGVMPDDQMLAAAGINRSQAQQLISRTVTGIGGQTYTPAQTTAPEGMENGELYNDVLADVQSLKKSGENAATINNVISAALQAGKITSAQASALRGAYVGAR